MPSYRHLRGVKFLLLAETADYGALNQINEYLYCLKQIFHYFRSTVSLGYSSSPRLSEVFEDDARMQLFFWSAVNKVPTFLIASTSDRFFSTDA